MVSRSFVPVLDKGMAIAFALRLAAKHHRDAEFVIITLIEHQPVCLATHDVQQNNTADHTDQPDIAQRPVIQL